MTAIDTASNYRLRLETSLKGALKAWVDYQTAYSLLVNGFDIYDSNRSITGLDVVEQALTKWLSAICNTLSQSYQGDTGKSFDASDLPSKLREIPRSLRHTMVDSYRQPDLTLWLSFADALIEQYDFEQLVQKVTVLAEGLEQSGMREIADRLVCNFWLRNHGRDNPIKRTKRHVVIESSLYSDAFFGGYSYDTKQKMSLMLEAIRVAATESGDNRLVPPFEELIEAVNNTPDRQLIKSGTAFGNKSTVEIKVYQGKFKCFFNPEVLDALLSFIIIHRTQEGELHNLPEAA
ncbi:hypothetical protein IC617_08545 [Neiella sp. HB171785]|uniref:DUF4942 domain-containing protein n=1 Tax=Neiella litorisoli TaxID=2771431 RepID=A0A8J6UEH7_9GAMM|nr:hypothetical protein [Neiella litorisoli]MBD1389474.1 hypothetical protein [Neiella litorisoli]